jgi:hypothetical protein
VILVEPGENGRLKWVILYMPNEHMGNLSDMPLIVLTLEMLGTRGQSETFLIY